MKLPVDGKLILQGRFNQNKKNIIEPKKPIPIKISPNSVLIYEISEK